jgi:hypothetical protein
VLTEEQRRLYARQVLLRELGPSGQARLCQSRVALGREADARAARVAHDYLQRAGLQITSEQDAAVVPVALPSAARVGEVAGDEALADCAAWLLGALAAVEAVKQCAGVGEPGQLDARFVLNAEVQ